MDVINDFSTQIKNLEHEKKVLVGEKESLQRKLETETLTAKRGAENASDMYAALKEQFLLKEKGKSSKKN